MSVSDDHLDLTLEALLNARMRVRDSSAVTLGLSANSGSSRSRVRGNGSEFDTVGPYLEGDDPRFIDWNATARSDRPQVRRFFLQAQRPVVIAIDCRSHMFFGTHGQVMAKTACLLAAGISWEFMRERRPIALIALDAQSNPWPGFSRSTRARNRLLVNLLARYEIAEKSLGDDDLATIIKRVGYEIPPRTDLLIISDFSDLGDEFDSAIGGLRQVSVRAISVEDAMPASAFSGWFPYRTSERGESKSRSVGRLSREKFETRVSRWHDDLSQRLAHAGVESLRRCNAVDLCRAMLR